MDNNFIPYEGYYYTIPAKLVEISPNPYIPLLYGLIMSLTHKEGYCWASNEFLAQKLKVSVSSLQRHLRWLEQFKFIKRSINQKVGNLRKIYLRNIPITETIKEKDVKITLINSKNNYTPIVTSDQTYSHPRPDPYSHPRLHSIKEESNKKSIILCPISKKSDESKHSPLNNKYEEEDLKIAEYQLNKLKSLRPSFKEPNLQKWAKDINLMRKIDKRQINTIYEALDLIYEHTFWKGVILSPVSLRKHFDKVYINLDAQKEKNRIQFNRNIVYQMDRLCKKSRDGHYEIQPDGLYWRPDNKFINFNLKSSDFVKVMNQYFEETYTMTNEEVKKYG